MWETLRFVITQNVLQNNNCGLRLLTLLSGVNIKAPEKNTFRLSTAEGLSIGGAMVSLYAYDIIQQ